MQWYFKLEIFHVITTVFFIIININEIGLQLKYNWNKIKSTYSVKFKKV